MSNAPRPLSLTSVSRREARVLLRQHWNAAARVDAAVSDAGWLCGLLGRPDRDPSCLVRLVCQQPPPIPWQTRWRCTVTDSAVTPEFVLFYHSAASRFPETAAVFAGGPGDRWLTLQQRPLVVYRLREHFSALLAGVTTRGAVAATAIREGGSNFEPIAHGTGSSDRRPQPHNEVTPDELYRRVLAAHFATLAPTEAESEDEGPGLAAHQLRAYERARHILERYGGVIVADATGLGKSHVGLRLLQHELDAGGRVLLIVPAALHEQWRRDLASFAISGLSATKTAPMTRDLSAENLEFWARESQHCRLELVSMESLGRRAFDPRRHCGVDLVIVDEAHHFRNTATRRHKNLSDITRHSRVVLLTATPINNSLLDLQHLIDLFAAPGAFRHLGISDYRDTFRRATGGGADITPILSACVLRRTRRFLRRFYGDIRVTDSRTGGEVQLRFPIRSQPTAVEYDLAGIYGELFENLHVWLDQLRFDSIDTRTGSGTAAVTSSALLKVILLKRLESSVEAFRSTVFQQLAWCKTALSALAAGRVLTRPDYRAAFRGPADDPGSQLTFFELVLPAPSIAEDRLNEFRQGLEHDRGILTRVHEALTSVGFADDRKLQRLLELLDGRLAGRKILLFTEFRDTARYLHHRLRQRPYLAKIDSGGARLGQQPASRREVIERFAPRSNGADQPPEHERVDLLIATDVLSEGLNLQDASTVISYDLPWNPVKLMQRMGRVDRLGAIADVVELHHFVPTQALEQLLGLLERLHGKLSTISDTLGLDNPVLATPSGARRLLSRIRLVAKMPDGYERLERQLDGHFDPEEQAYIDHVAFGTAIANSDFQAPVVSAAASDDCLKPRAAAYWRVSAGDRRRGLWLVCDVETGCVIEDQAEALALFRSAIRAKAIPMSRHQLHHVRHSCARQARLILERLEVTQIAGDSLNPGLPQCRIAARLSRYLEHCGDRLPARRRMLIDDLLQRLMQRFTRAEERRLAEMAHRLPEQIDGETVIAIDAYLADLDGERRAGLELCEVATLVVLPESAHPKL